MLRNYGYWLNFCPFYSISVRCDACTRVIIGKLIGSLLFTFVSCLSSEVPLINVKKSTVRHLPAFLPLPPVAVFLASPPLFSDCHSRWVRFSSSPVLLSPPASHLIYCLFWCISNSSVVAFSVCLSVCKSRLVYESMDLRKTTTGLISKRTGFIVPIPVFFVFYASRHALSET